MDLSGSAEVQVEAFKLLELLDILQVKFSPPLLTFQSISGVTNIFVYL